MVVCLKLHVFTACDWSNSNSSEAPKIAHVTPELNDAVRTCKLNK